MLPGKGRDVIPDILVELFEADVVEQATAGPAPEGTRGLELAVIGAMLVKAQASTESQQQQIVDQFLRSVATS
jgi:hypothetical protein